MEHGMKVKATPAPSPCTYTGPIGRRPRANRRQDTSTYSLSCAMAPWLWPWVIHPPGPVSCINTPMPMMSCTSTSPAYASAFNFQVCRFLIYRWSHWEGVNRSGEDWGKGKGRYEGMVGWGPFCAFVFSCLSGLWG